MKKPVISLVVVGILVVTVLLFKDKERRNRFIAKLKALLHELDEKVGKGIEEAKRLLDA
jgi:hypothetical protein